MKDTKEVLKGGPCLSGVEPEKGIERTRKGKPVVVAEEFDRRGGLLVLAWSHKLSTFEFMRRINAFTELRQDFRTLVEENAKLRLLMPEIMMLSQYDDLRWATNQLIGILSEEESNEVEDALRRMRGVVLFAQRGARGSPEAEE